MGALHSASRAETPHFPLGLFYRRFWFGNNDAILDNIPENYPQLDDLVIVLPVAVGITLFRYVIFETLFRRFAIYCLGLPPQSLFSEIYASLSSNVKNVINNYKRNLTRKQASKKKKGVPLVSKEERERALASLSSSSSSLPSTITASSLLSSVSREVVRDNKIAKFQEAGWRFTFYSFIVILGAVVVTQEKLTITDMSRVWPDWETYIPSTGLRWYYYLSAGHYIHLLAASFWDVKRSDFYQMMLHHVVTLLLLFQSYMQNYLKIGACVLILHDIADIFLEVAKLFNYSKRQMLTDSFFVIFALVFIVTRCFYFPAYLIHSSLVDGSRDFGMSPAWYMFNGMLILLLILNIVWAYVIVRMIVKFARKGQVDGDDRSDNDEEETEQDEQTTAPEQKKQK